MSGAQMTAAAAAAAMGGTLLQVGAERFDGVSIDSRRVASGQAFVAIVGDRLDGHDFCGKAADAGAALLVVSREPAPPPPPRTTILRVDDTRLALGALARAWRTEVDPRVVAITGSIGKTTTKELTRAVTSRLGPTHGTRGNFNNDIGLPLTLLSMPAGTGVLVAEMGMNAPGEIAYLTGLARPDVGVITCVAPVHLEGLGSLEAVAAAKGELLEGLQDDSWAVVPGQEPLLEPFLGSVAAGRRVRFGASATDDVRIVQVQGGRGGIEITLSLRGEEVVVQLPLVGAYNARNAAAAAAAGMILGLPPDEIRAALQEPPRLEHRSTVRQVGPWRVLDDCYNANPVAMDAAISTVRDLAGAAGAVAVLGKMLELGEDSDRYHREVGRSAARAGLRGLIVVDSPELARGAREAGMPGGEILEVAAAAAGAAAARIAAPGTWILIKASRGAHLEQVISDLQQLVGEEATNSDPRGEPPRLEE